MKVARLSTAREKEQKKRYRQANKAAIARKAKIRRRKIESGAQMQRRRSGTAAGGYTFTATSRQVKGPKVSMSMSTSKPASGLDFNPARVPHGTRRTERMPKIAARAHVQLGIRNAMLQLLKRKPQEPIKQKDKGDAALNSFRASQTGASLGPPQR
jgi:hypothetical protein